MIKRVVALRILNGVALLGLGASLAKAATLSALVAGLFFVTTFVLEIACKPSNDSCCKDVDS